MQIYKTINNITGQIYIGKDESDRKSYYGSGKYLKRALEKYGKENFTKEIIDTCYDREHLCFMECFHIQQNPECKVENGGYNILKGGQGFHGNHTEETKLKFRNRKYSEDFKNKLRIVNLGRKSSIETKMKKSKSVIDNNGNKYFGIRQACLETGISYTNISAVCRGKRKTAGGLVWRFENA